MTMTDPARTTQDSPPDRVRELLARMTTREKVGQLNQRLFGWQHVRRTRTGYVLSEELLAHAEHWGGIGAVYGLHRADAWSGQSWSNGIAPEAAAEVTRQLQDAVAAVSRLAVPALIVEEAPHGHQGLGGTLLPTTIGQAATFDPEWVAERAAAVAAELASVGAHVALVSGLDLARDPRWGRSEECFGEDPLLAAELTGATVAAMQGEGERIDAAHVAVVVKHLAAQGAAAGGRNAASAVIGRRELHEIHLPPARSAVLADAAGFMSAYNDIDGVPCSANRDLLTGLLRQRWGSRGIVMSDMGALDRLAGPAGGLVEAGALALNAGVDMSMGDVAFTLLEEALARGLVNEAAIDLACERVLRLKDRLGLLDGARSVEAPVRPRFPVPPVDASALVLVKNDGALPLPPGIERVAVIGPNAQDVGCLLGDYVPPLPAGEGVSIAEGLVQTLAAEVRCERGSMVRGELPGGIGRAVDLARWAEVVVLALGGSSRRRYDGEFEDNGAAAGAEDLDVSGGEGADLADVRLPGAQRELVEAVAEAVAGSGTRIVTVMVTGRAQGASPALELSDALLYAWYPGPDGGRVIAETLIGNDEPAGRMPVSVPRSSAELPVTYDRRLEWSPRYLTGPVSPETPFGAGLGYTSWTLGPVEGVPAAAGIEDVDAGRVGARVRVTNTGRRAGSQVVQLYGRLMVPGLAPRTASLLGHSRVRLEPGESREVEVRIAPSPPALAAIDGPGRLALVAGLDSSVSFDEAVEIDLVVTAAGADSAAL